MYTTENWELKRKVNKTIAEISGLISLIAFLGMTDYGIFVGRGLYFMRKRDIMLVVFIVEFFVAIYCGIRAKNIEIEKLKKSE